MTNSNNKKAEQLGMPHGTASARLKKLILFNLLKELKRNFCHQCGTEILTADELSIEHKIPYLDSDDPVKMFFEMDNVAYSHLSCNSGAARQTQIATHPSLSAYRNGCRCNECRSLERIRRADQRERGIKT